MAIAQHGRRKSDSNRQNRRLWQIESAGFLYIIAQAVSAFAAVGVLHGIWTMQVDDRPLNRDDFFDDEQWLRFCHEGGLDAFGPDVLPYWSSGASGEWARRFAATYPTGDDGPSPWDLTEQPSMSLSLAQFEAAYRAVAFANCRGRVLNAFITITWSTVGILEDRAVAFHQDAFFDELRRWFRQETLWPAFVWTMENGAVRGLHSHILAAVPGPRADAFRSWSIEALARVVARPLVDTETTKTILTKVERNESVTAQWACFRYLFKGLTPHAMRTDPLTGHRTPTWYILGLNHANQRQVRVERAGVSMELQADAITRWVATHPVPHLPPLPLISEMTSPANLYSAEFIEFYFKTRGPSLWGA